MGNAGHVGPLFWRAVDQRDYQGARLLALELRAVNLDAALALTLLAAETGEAPFEPHARRWVAKLIAEKDPPLTNLAVVAQLLADVAEGQLVPSKALEPLSRAAQGRRLG